MSVQTGEAPPEDKVPIRPAATAVPPGRGRKRASGGLPYLLLLPALGLTVIFLGYPLVQNGVLSFQNLNMTQLIQHVTEWRGFGNYGDTLTSETFWRVTLRSVLFTLVNVVLIMGIGTLVGLLLARLGSKMRLTLLIGLILAWAMPVIAATTVYQWLFAQRFGVVNWVLDKVGFSAMADYNWTGSQLSTFFVITLLIVWTSVPFVAVNIYAASTTIPRELYEAAALDGAGALKSFRAVTLPFLRPFLMVATFLEVIWVFKAFPHVFAVNEGGPDRLTETLPVYAFVEGVGNQHYGAGAAIAVLTILILLALMSYYLRMVLRQEAADEEGEPGPGATAGAGVTVGEKS
ncbi:MULTISPECIES: carbohydrate ABC transporter permease [Streptomyces]|uniref:Sugar ABC transporter permease n=1 Tax=Streptomyces cacaoi TaxID=1898 RepID=A0A4Y3R049_STRCI|nr:MULTISPECIES: sugar ABC transporter permease [Streptomyces]NNG86360.1 sugar ABC transporter permease [Streptomyces cacaoi]QHF97024.1 sugar ABC transporter permease [Streptomyces sp. NHF165]GEB50599.1 sugar ABC transporter permease [Streptomyces cacaoi]